MSLNFNKLYINGLWTQCAFHRVQEHPKRISLLRSILILIFLPYMHLFIHIFTISIMYSLFTIYYSLLVFTIHYYVFTIHLRIHYSYENPAKSRDFGTHA